LQPVERNRVLVNEPSWLELLAARAGFESASMVPPPPYEPSEEALPPVEAARGADAGEFVAPSDVEIVSPQTPSENNASHL